MRQLLPCVVVKVEDDKKDGKGSKRIWISLRLSLVHKGLSLDAIQEGMVSSLKFVELHNVNIFAIFFFEKSGILVPLFVLEPISLYIFTKGDCLYTNPHTHQPHTHTHILVFSS